MSQLAALGQEAGGVVRAVGPSVVTIGRDGRGAGAVVADGRVVTNAHNLRGQQVTVTFADGRVATGTVAGVDVDADLAVVAVDTAGAPPLQWADARDEQIDAGMLVFAVTNSPGGGPRLTWGLVSATGQAFRGPRGRRIADALEHTVPLARGSSGGPLVDGDGRLVGINTHRRGDGFYLAVPATTELSRRLDALGEGHSPSRVTLGIAVAPAHVARRLRSAVGLPPQDGLLVRGVDDDGPAARAGVRAGDLIIEANGQPTTSSDDLFAILDQLEAGTIVRLKIVRGVERVDVAVTFGSTEQEGSA
ncbi:MAG: S1C family serine protease [Egibacteraceae bacterium]